MVNFGPSLRTYTSQREVVYARRGMVCTTQPLASQAGLAMLKKGGNAIDAAIAAAACMTVLEPTSNGIGGDAFALVWCQNHLYGLNSSGFAPQAITAEAVRSRYGHTMPTRGFVPVTVPGIPAAWASLSERFGTLPFEELLEPAIAYAEEGYPLAATTASLWKEASNTFAPYSDDPAFSPWFETFLPNGKAPDAGDIIVLPDHAKTLRTLAQSRCHDFYSGDLADRIDAFAHAHGGFLRKGDLEHFSPEWVSPISTNYRGFTVHEIPPNGQGLIALMALNILENFEPTADMADTVHHQIEAMKLAFSDGTAYIADPKAMPISTETLLSKAYSCERYAQIHAKAQVFGPGNPYSGGTVYLAAADGMGNMVSFIQSNYQGFGSGIVIPDTGIALQNRGANFSLDPQSPNCLAPGKKPYHTIIPGFLSRDNHPIGPFGVMGAFMQPQGHLQVISNTVDRAMNPQESLDAPRWQWLGDKRIEVEMEFPRAIIQSLLRRGHDVRIVSNYNAMGRGQIIWRKENGVLVGGTEKRADGAIACW